MRILVAEDEPMMAGIVAEWLRADAHAVDIVHDGDSVLERLAVNEYDVLVLDRDLPVIHGDDVCRSVTAQTVAVARRPAIIMVTAAGELEDCVSGLALGADDYLAKPFACAELSARVHALGRRPRVALPPVLERQGLRVDVSRRLVQRDGVAVRLTAKEFGVLVALMRAEGAVVSSEQLLEAAWDEHADPFTTAVRVTVHKLRRRLGAPEVIETVASAGYRLR